VIDDTLGDEVRVTVIAAGFDGGEPPPKKVSVKDSVSVEAQVFGQSVTKPKAVSFDDTDDDLDIPDFLK